MSILDYKGARILAVSILDLLACDRRSARRRHVNGASNSVKLELPRP